MTNPKQRRAQTGRAASQQRETARLRSLSEPSAGQRLTLREATALEEKIFRLG